MRSLVTPFPLSDRPDPCESSSNVLCVANRAFGRTTWPRRDERA
jgi:hypothetical protein